MSKLKIIIYALFAIAFQLILGYFTGKGQGGIGMLTFVVLIELDPNYSFTYLLQNQEESTVEQSENDN
ncbi:MAG: hypothetical protein K9L26_05190 [Candidatus Izimaplasma sp.]|nr:hypothetical protein [Candidatus Izimaplasma bacterium]